MSRAESTRTVGGLRRRMPRHLLPAFCLSLLLLGCTCGPAYCANGGPADSVQPRVSRETVVPENMGSDNLMRDVSSFASPFLVGGNGVMVALAEAQYTGKGKQNTGIVARYIETEGPNGAVRAIENNGTNWKTQLVLKAAVNHSVLRSPTAGIINNKIYLLALSNRTKDSSQSGNGWHFELVVGEIKGEEGSKKIGWWSSVFLRSKLTEMVKKKGWKVFPGYNNSAFLASGKTIVFSMNAKNTENTSGFVIMLFYAEYELWGVSFVENPEECRVFSLLEWKKRFISVLSGCATNNIHVKEYDEEEEEWKKVDDTLLLVWGFSKTSNDFTPVTIGNKNVLLFTEEGYPRRFADGGKSAIRLGITDGFRVHVAHILTQSSNVTSGGLVYTNDELFFMYQDTDNGLGAIVFKRLDDELRRIKSVLNDWAANDAYLSKPCDETAPEDVSPDTLCVTPMPTDGLVGFFSDRGGTYWIDNYHLTGAYIKGGTKVKNGYTFCGAGEGAWWSVGQTYFSKWYNFVKYGLTVVATVTVHETPKGDSPLLTVDGVGSYERLGLWYKGGQWKGVSNDGKEEPAMDLETQNEYRVALIVHNNTISAYVNGNLLRSSLPKSTSGKNFEILNVYIGGYEYGTVINMTVTNVLLYNRVLSDTEFEAASKTVSAIKRKDFKEKFETPKSSEESIEMPRSTKETTEPAPEPTNTTAAAPEPTNTTAPAPGPTNTTAPAPGPTNTTAAAPGPTNTTEMPREPEDSSVCVRLSFALLFILGCFCLAIFC